jgi:hypothetical protein
MRIFFSHSSRDKPLIREIQENLPQHVRAWIDERELLVGEDLKTSIRHAITLESDFVIIVIGPEAVRSKWVRRELKWALERERQIGRVFVLPVLLDKDSWGQLPKEFQERRYLPCTDLTEPGVKEFSKRLADELFAWVSRYSLPNRRKDSAFEQVDVMRRRARVRKLAQLIADDQENATDDTRLTKERLEFIVSSLDWQRKVELLSLYEMQYGRFRRKFMEQDLERSSVLRIEFRLPDVGEWTHDVDWVGNSFAELRQEYGLGRGKYDVRNVFLEAIGRLSKVERRKMFSGLEIINCSLER